MSTPDSMLAYPLAPGRPVQHWQLSAIAEARYDVAPQPMAGEMDPFFFLTKHKNFIPHEYPCRTAFAAEYRGRTPVPMATFEPTRWWLPFASPRVDLSGFWFRPTRIGAWGRTFLDLAASGTVKLRLATCGGALLQVDGQTVGEISHYVRNLETTAEWSVDLAAGRHEIRVYIDDLAERDTRFIFQLDYLSGPQATVMVPVPADPAQAGRLEALLDGLRFDKPGYTEGEVALLLPAPVEFDLGIAVGITGDFISADATRRAGTIAAGETRFVLGTVDDLPPDCRSHTVTLSLGGYAVSRTLAVEICPVAAQGNAPASLGDRIAEALDHVALNAEADPVRALARLATGRGGAGTDAMLDASLPAIIDCHDCADFLLVPMLWGRITYSDGIGAATRARIDDAITGFRYWMDEPGNDVQWYFSENHALLFHTAAYLAGTFMPGARFTRSGRTGAEQATVGRDRVRAWLDHFEHWEMAEWNSAPYFPIDLKGLVTLFALAPDADIRERAGRSIVRLIEIVARSAHHGVLTGSQGRSYEFTLRPARTLELAAIARLVFGAGNYGRRFHCLPQLALALRDHGLDIPVGLAAIADHQGPDALEWCFAQGQDRIAKLYHYKSCDFAMGSIAAYRPGQWGYQETVLQLRLGQVPEAQVFINHPGEVIQSGSGRPSYWGGCGTLPRVHQYRALAVLDFDIAEGQPDFTHAYLPLAAFDEVILDGDTVLLRSGTGLALIRASGPLEIVRTGPSADSELRLMGRQGRWVVRLGSDAASQGREGGLIAFGKRLTKLELAQTDENGLLLIDPDYGEVRFGATGVVTAEGRTLDPAGWSIKGSTTRFDTA